MVTVGSLLSRVEKQRVLGVLHATGSRDPDILHAQKLALLAAAKRPLVIGTVLFVAGIVASATVSLAPLGIPIALLGWNLRRRGVRNVSNVQDGFAQYLNHHD